MVTTPPPDPALVELFRSELSEHACKLADTFKSAISIPSTEMLAELAGRAYSIESAARILSFEPVAELAARVKELLVGDLQRATTSQRDAAINRKSVV